MKSPRLLATIVAAILLCQLFCCKRKDTCPDGAHSTINIVNNSADTIALRISPDTIWHHSPAVVQAGPTIIVPGGTYPYTTAEGCWENHLLKERPQICAAV